MPPLTNVNPPFVIEHWLTRTEVDGILPFGTRKVKPARDLDPRLKLCFTLLDQLSEALQNLVDFALLDGFRFAKLIVCLNHSHRLDKRRLPSSRKPVHNAL